MNTGKKYLSILLAFILAFSMMGGLALAEDPTVIKIASFTAYTTDTTIAMYDGEVKELRMSDYFNDPDYTPPATPTLNYVGEQLVWTLSDTKIASITRWDDENGWLNDGTYTYYPEYHMPRIRFTSVPGEVIIKGANQDGSISAQLKVTVKAAGAEKNPVTAVKFTQPEYMVRLDSSELNKMGDFVRMTWQNPDQEGEEIRTTWSVADSTVAEISTTGLVTPLKTGSTNVTVTVKNLVSGTTVADTAKITVLDNPVTKLTFAPAEYTMRVGGSNISIFNTLTAEPLGVEVDPSAIVYSSDDSSVAYVTGSGEYVYLYAAGPGTANITATYFNKIAGTYVTSNAIKVTVTEVPVETITIAPKEFKVVAGTDSALNLSDFTQIKPNNASYGMSYVQWYSSDISVVDVGDTGYVYGISPGEATITARIYNKVAKKVVTGSCKIIVVGKDNPVEKVSFTQESFKMKVTDNYLALGGFLLTEPVFYNDDDVLFTWTTSDYAVAAVQKDSGKVVPRGVGEATITVSLYNLTAKTTVTASVKVVVEDVKPVEKIALKPAAFAMTVGETLLWTAKNYMVVTPADAEGYEVTLVDAGDGVVSIDGYELYAEKPGTTKVEVSVYNPYKKNYVTASFTVTVTDRIPLKGISFKKDTYELKMPYSKNLGGQLKMDPANAKISDYNWIWESSDMETATVDPDGTVIGKKVGTTTITVSLLDDEANVVAKASTQVKVGVITAKKIALNKTQTRLYFTSTEHEDYQSAANIYALIQPSNAYVSRVEWETTDAGVAIVDRYVASKGSSSSYGTQIVATGVGVCTVTARVFTMDETGNELELTKTVKVLVCDKTVELKLNAAKKTLYLKKGEDVTFTLEAKDKATGDLVDVRWTSSKPSIASVDSFGVVTALKAGTAVITATTRDGNRTTATSKITVKKNKVTKITTKTKLTMKVGDVLTPAITVKPATAFNPALKFKSSKPAIVAVSAEGELTALKAGTAVITITAADGSKKTAKITITVK